MSEVSLVDGHIDNGMSDEDIIKALECCSYAKSTIDCRKCPYYPDKECVKKQCTDIIDLINRKNAEIEILKEKYSRLESDKEILQGNHYSFHDGQLVMIPRTDKTKIKAEAIKEFAERLKCNASILCDRVTGLPCSYTISNYNFNRLIKEMTESK